ncbi:MAG: hypothetical protein ABL958_03350 [Bdellovibrionia bacterium]
MTDGSYKAEVLKLTNVAAVIFNEHAAQEDVLKAKFQLAIASIPLFKELYDKFKGGRLPAVEVMKDALPELGQEDRQRCIEIFINNVKYVGLLSTKNGAEWLLNIEDVPAVSNKVLGTSVISNDLPEILDLDFEKICFFVAPIGDEGTEVRKHSDMILESFVEEAVRPLDLRVVRADKITKPGIITKQVVEHLLYSRLVIVDMSYHNPNVFYELAIRHLMRRPTVHIIRKSDNLPFDVGNFRTIIIDDADKYDLIAKLTTYRAEIANAANEALAGSSSEDNPITAFFPDLRLELHSSKTEKKK